MIQHIIIIISSVRRPLLKIGLPHRFPKRTVLRHLHPLAPSAQRPACNLLFIIFLFLQVRTSIFATTHVMCPQQNIALMPKPNDVPVAENT